MASNFKDVQAMHRHFNITIHDKPTHLTARKLHERINFMQEELDEFNAAVNEQDMSEMADALIDLVIVAMGTAAMMGLPWKELFKDVHRANLAKVRGVGKRGHAVDLIKPEGWQGPLTKFILADAGYVPAVDALPENHYDDPEYK